MTNPITIQEAKISSKACECFSGSIVCGKRPAGEFMREGWPDSMILCTDCEADAHSHEPTPLDLRVFHLTGELATISREASEHAAARAKLVDELRAIRILDAWTEKHEEAMPPTPVFHKYLSKGEPGLWACWTISLPRDGRISIERFSTATKARIAAADALAKEDPSLLEGIE